MKTTIYTNILYDRFRLNTFKKVLNRMVYHSFIAIICLFFANAMTHSKARAQEVEWLNSWPMDYNLNPILPEQLLVSSSDFLFGVRLTSYKFAYGADILGDLSLDRYDSSTGELIWSCELSGNLIAGAAVVDESGIAYFTGRFIGDQIETCQGVTLPGGGGQFEIHHFLLALDMNDGEILWLRNLSALHPDANAITSLAIDPEGRLWYVVEEWGTGKIVRVNEEGIEQETRILIGPRRMGTLSFDPWGGAYVSGAADEADFTFGGQTFQVEQATGYKMFVLRYRADGTAGFVEFANDETFKNPTVIASNDGHAFLADNLISETQWGDLYLFEPEWLSTVFITKVDSTGNFIWSVQGRSLPGGISGDVERSKGPCITIDNQGVVYFIANQRGLVDWGNDIVSGMESITARTITILGISNDGIPIWSLSSLSNGYYNNAQTITASINEESIYFAAQINSEFNFPPHNTNSNDIQASMVGQARTMPLSISERHMNNSLAFWPNPTLDRINFQIESKSNLEGKIWNSTGQLRASIQLQPGLNQYNVEKLSPGIYFMQLENGQQGSFIVNN